MATFQRQDFGYSRTVSYINHKHLALIFQRWGSVNRKVLPFCCANVLISIVLVYLLERGIDLTISEFGHEFMSVLVAFLVINKLSFTLGLYYEIQGHLSKINQSSIELTQLACAFTSGYDQEEYKEWRLNVTIHVLMLLSATVSMIYKGGEENVWEISALKDHPLKLCVSENNQLDDPRGSSNTTNLHDNRRSSLPKELYIWGMSLKSDKNLRVPIRLAHRLRNKIMEHKLLPADPLDTIQEQTLLNFVKEFMDSYHGVRKYLTCPLPLPLVQLGRVFVLCYVFTLPFALLSPELNLQYFQMILLTWLMTYGFIGIELLYVEIDDPFAEDPNDLPLIEESRAAAEDICLSLLHADGRESADRLLGHFDQVKAHGPRLFQRGAKETDPLV